MVSVPSAGSDPHEKRVKSLAALIRKVFREIAKSFTSSLSGTVTMSDATQVRTAWGQQLSGVVLGHIRETYTDGAGFIADAAGTDELIGEDLVANYIQQARNRLVGVGNDVWLDVRAQIKMGLDAGESVQEIAERIKNVAQVPTSRALKIARTETHTAYEAGAYEQAKFVGGGTKTWLATNDDKTRETHKKADGQSVPVEEPFTVGASSLRFPGDPLGGPHETIQCRCSVAYEFAELSVLTPFEDLALVAAGKWNPSAHPRGNDGKFIKKGAVADLLSKGKPNIQDVANAVVELTPDVWEKLTAPQKTYIAESMEKLPPSLKAPYKKSFHSNVGQSIENAVSGPNTTKVAPKFAKLLKDAKHGEVVATGTKNGKAFRVTAIKDLTGTKFNPTYNPDGVLQLEILKKDGTPSVVGGKTGSPHIMKDAIHDYYKPKGFATKVVYDLKPGLHPAIADVLSNASDPNLGGETQYMIGTQLTHAWQAVQEGHWDQLTPIQQKTLLDVTFTNGNEKKMAQPNQLVAEEHQAKFNEENEKSKLQKLWDKGLMTTEEFFATTGEYPTDSKQPAPNVLPTGELNAIKLSDYNTGDVIAQSSVTGDYVEKMSNSHIELLDADGTSINSHVLGAYSKTISEFISDNTTGEGWSVVQPPGKSTATPLAVPATPTQTKIPDGLKGKPGDPAKATTSVIWGKHSPGTVVLENPDGSEHITWDGKKYNHVVDGTIQNSWTKKDAYANLKNDTHWVIPGGTPSVEEEAPPEDVFGFSMGEPKSQGVPIGKKLAKSVPPKAPDLEPDDVIPGLAVADKVFLLDEAEDNNLTINEAISLVNSLSEDDVKHNLSGAQINNITTTLEKPGNFAPGLSDAIKTWNSFLPLAGDDGQDQPPLTGDPITSLDIVNAVDGGLTNGQVLAVANDGKSRIVWSTPLGGFMVQEYSDHDKEWIDAESYYPGDEDPSFDELVEVMLHDWSMYTWLRPTSGDLKPKATTDPIPYTDESVIENWPGVLKWSADSDKVLAVTTDGKYQLTSNPVSAALFDVKVKGSSGQWHLATTVSEESAPNIISTYGDTWVVPPKKPQVPKPADLPSGDALIPSKTAFESGLKDGVKPGTVIVEGTLPTVPHAAYRLVVTNDKFVSLEFKNVKMTDGKWIEVDTYASYEGFKSGWPNDPFQWTTNLKYSKPTADTVDTTPAVPSPLPPSPPVQPAAPTPTTPVPFYHVQNFKNILKSEGKVGYWSKPEKIWDGVKKIQAAYPDPNNPGHSKYTPTQILEALDGNINTSQPKPYTTKINKWAATAKGGAYINSHVGGATVTATQNVHLSGADLDAIVSKVGSKSYPTGTVLFTGSSAAGVPHQISISSSNVMNLQSYNPLTKQWQLDKMLFTSMGLKQQIDKYGMQPTSAVKANTVTPPPVATPAVKPPPGVMGLDLGTGDISHLTEAKKQQLYAMFKQQPSTYLDSPAKNIYAALKTIGDQESFSTLQMIRVIDDVGAKKVNQPDQHMFEKKILDWLKSPQGAAIASGQPLPKPPQPAFKPGVNPDAQIPSFEASNAYAYNVLPKTSASAWFNKVKDKYGKWTSAESSALKTYTGGSYLSINPYLWGDLDSVSSTHAEAIKSAQSGMRPSLEPVLLHRGMGFAGIGNAKNHDQAVKMIGQTWKSDGFMSTSIGGTPAFGGDVLLEVEAPPGTPMAWIDPISYHKGENEMLLAAGLHFKIISVKKSGYKSVIRVRVVPDPTAGGAV